MAESTNIVEYQSRDKQEIKLSFDNVRKFLVSGRPQFVTDQEIVFFMAVCKSRGLNPFKRDAYLVKYTENDAAAIITSIDYYRSRSKAQPDCQGWKCGVIVKDLNNVIYREGSWVGEREQLLGGWFEAQPKGWAQPFKWTVSLKPYVKTTREGKETRFWSQENQAYMIVKVAESQGLRRLWPDEFQGLMMEEEIDKATDVTPEPEPTQSNGKAQAPEVEAKTEKAAPKSEADEADLWPDYKDKLTKRLLKDAGNSKDAQEALLKLTGKRFMTNVSAVEAKEALARYEAMSQAPEAR